LLSVKKAGSIVPTKALRLNVSARERKRGEDACALAFSTGRFQAEEAGFLRFLARYIVRKFAKKSPRPDYSVKAQMLHEIVCGCNDFWIDLRTQGNKMASNRICAHIPHDLP
jgi:hypothetical protein